MKLLSPILFSLTLILLLGATGCAKNRDTPPEAPQQQQNSSVPNNIPTPATPSATPVTYLTHIKPILEARCVNCHRAEGSADEIPLDSYDQVMKTVEPNNPETSSLIKSVDGGSMTGKASGSEVDILKQWVKEGAKQ